MTLDANYYALDPDDQRTLFLCTVVDENGQCNCPYANARLLTPNEGAAVCVYHADRLAYTDHH